MTKRSINIRKAMLGLTAGAAIALSPLALSHFDDKEVPQSYRQSFFALVALNFGPMASMVKGEMPWDQERMQSYANDLETLTTLDIMRCFVDGSD